MSQQVRHLQSETNKIKQALHEAAAKHWYNLCWETVSKGEMTVQRGQYSRIPTKNTLAL